MTFKVKQAGAVLELTGKAVAAPEGAPASALQQMAQPAAQGVIPVGQTAASKAAWHRGREMILIALVLSAATPAGRWVHVGGSTNLYEEYVDRESIKRSGDKVTLWTRRDLALDGRTVWNELEFDCRTRTETILAYIQDDGRSVVHNTVRPHREAALIPPGSVEERIFNIACR